MAGDIIFAWAESVWIGYPKLEILEAVMQAAKKKAASTTMRRSMWRKARSPADVLVRKMEEIGWHPTSARHWTIHTGMQVDLLSLAPAALEEQAQRAGAQASDVVAMQRAL